MHWQGGLALNAPCVTVYPVLVGAGFSVDFQTQLQALVGGVTASGWWSTTSQYVAYGQSVTSTLVAGPTLVISSWAGSYDTAELLVQDVVNLCPGASCPLGPGASSVPWAAGALVAAQNSSIVAVFRPATVAGLSGTVAGTGTHGFLNAQNPPWLPNGFPTTSSTKPAVPYIEISMLAGEVTLALPGTYGGCASACLLLQELAGTVTNPYGNGWLGTTSDLVTTADIGQLCANATYVCMDTSGNYAISSSVFLLPIGGLTFSTLSLWDDAAQACSVGAASGITCAVESIGGFTPGYVGATAGYVGTTVTYGTTNGTASSAGRRESRERISTVHANPGR